MASDMESIRESDLSADPFVTFQAWFGAASKTQIEEANAMNLSTCADGEVSSRVVLMKYWDANGFVFFTNYGSRKARQIDKNPKVALLFYWECLHRQVRIEGTARRVPMVESLKYFATRPRGSQLGAWCSAQSTVISSREMLLAKLEEVKHRFAAGEVPLPTHWGGYRVTPGRIEFWQQGADRLHDRFLYERQADGPWALRRLAP